MTRWSLCDRVIIHLSNKALDYDQGAIKAEKDLRSLHFSDASYFPGLLKLPYPVQRLVVDELKKENLLLEEGKEGREIKDEITCDCFFFGRNINYLVDTFGCLIIFLISGFARNLFGRHFLPFRRNQDTKSMKG